MLQKLIVAIDGPAGSGKSTTAKIVAKKLDYLYIDSGAMYRAVTYLAIKKNVLKNDDEIIKLATESDIELEFIDGKTSVKINGEDFTEFIRSHEVNYYVSHISKLEGVRKALVEKQKAMSSGETGIVMEGRDIGTAVFPDADVKIFLTASIDKRAVRRAKEYEEKGSEISVDEVKKNLLERDDIDSTRDISPLVKAPDAIEVDTSQVSIEDQVKIILNHIHKKYK
jgi:CMP/dCMP kinase